MVSFALGSCLIKLVRGKNSLIVLVPVRRRWDAELRRRLQCVDRRRWWWRLPSLTSCGKTSLKFIHFQVDLLGTETCWKKQPEILVSQVTQLKQIFLQRKCSFVYLLKLTKKNVKHGDGFYKKKTILLRREWSSLLLSTESQLTADNNTR